GRRRNDACFRLARLSRLGLHFTLHLADQFSVGTEECERDFGAGFLIFENEVYDRAVRRIRSFGHRTAAIATSPAAAFHAPRRRRREEVHVLRSEIRREL